MMNAHTTEIRRMHGSKKLGTAICVTSLALGLSTASGIADVLHVPGQYATIQAAIDAASPGDEVHIAAGTYEPSTTIDTLGKAITLRGFNGNDGTPITTIDGQDSIRVFICQSKEGPQTIFENLRIIRGSAHNGAGMKCSYSNPTFLNCVFEDNDSVEEGGGVFVYEGSPVFQGCSFLSNSGYPGSAMDFRGEFLLLVDCEFKENERIPLTCSGNAQFEGCTFAENTNSSYGSAGFRYWPNDPNASLIVTNCAFKENASGVGGAMELNSGTILITDCSFIGNTAYSGGAIWAEEDASVTINNGVFIANHGVGLEGIAGAICSTGSLDIDNSEFRDNTSRTGGALYTTAQLIVKNTLFQNNAANDSEYYAQGGAIHSRGATELRNCRFESNQGISGAGIEMRYTSEPLVVTNCTFISNNADDGGGICGLESSGQITVTDSFFCGNMPEPIGGEWIDNGGNCLMLMCTDSNGDGEPECGTVSSDMELTVPGEFASIEQAIDAAPDGAVIQVAAGTYQPQTTLNTLGKALTIRGDVPDKNGNPTTIIDGADSIQVFRFASGEDATTTLEHLRIQNGSAQSGGGIHCGVGSTPTITRCVFLENSATSGGGVYCSDSDPVFSHCRILNNSAMLGGGGGMKLDQSNPSVLYCEFNDNSSEEAGGGIYNLSSSPTITNSTFQGNFSASTYRGGGAICNRYSSNPTIGGSSFHNNVSAGKGGAIFNSVNNISGPIMLSNCLFSGNMAEDGGAIANDETSTMFYDCTFLENSATEQGGAIYNEGTLSNSGIFDCEFRNNTALEGGGGIRHRYGSMALFDTTLCGNTPDQILGDFFDGGGNTLTEQCPECPADLNDDGVVNGLDLGIFFVAWGSCAECRADFNGDGEVNGLDLGIFFVAWGICQ